MSLLQMSFSGAVMIIAIWLVRMLAVNRLPKKVFVLLWEIAFLRLLIPFSIPSEFSAYSMLMEIPIIQEIFTESEVNTLIPEAQGVQFAANNMADAAIDIMGLETQETQPIINSTGTAIIMGTQEMLSTADTMTNAAAGTANADQITDNVILETQSTTDAEVLETQGIQSTVIALILEAQKAQSMVNATADTMSLDAQETPSEISIDTTFVPTADSFPVWTFLWVAGMVICALFFLISYFRCYREFKMSLPVDHAFVEKWMKDHQIKRAIRIRQSDRVSSPLAYGIFYPIILMPKTTDWNDIQCLQYILQHEYVHIRRFDMIRKLAASLVLCIHWFNPAVWFMYVIYNRDIELSCDESVVRTFGESSKSLYAKALIAMEEKWNSLQPLSNNFSKNAIEERIRAVMKTKKVTVWAAVISVAVVVIIIAVFATSAITERDEQKSMYIVTGEDTPSANISHNAGQADDSVPMSSSEGISDNTGIPNADIEETNISEYIDKYVALTSDTEIERWEMLNHNGENILRIRVGYHQDDLRGTIQGHKEDYFIFINGDQESVLQVGYEDKDIGMACNYDAVFEDVTFDGNDDLLIWLGDFGASSIYCAFIYENGQYRYEKSFENIPSYRVDTENHVISGMNRNSAVSHTDYTYEYQNGEFVEVEERTIDLEYQDGVYIENEYINGALINTKEVEYDG